MKALVAYVSRNGHTRRAAEIIGQSARQLGAETTVKSVIELRKADVDAADVVFIGTWVHGLILFGVRPAGAESWVPALPPLAGKRVGVFCTYAFHPRRSLKTLDDLLRNRGATIVGERAFHRSRPGDGAQRFVESVFQAEPTPA